MKDLLKGLLLILLLSSPIKGKAQYLDHPLGEILFQLEDPAKLESFKSSLLRLPVFTRKIPSFDLVSDPLKIWKVKFDHGQVHEYELLQIIKRHPHVQSAQLNHFLDARNIPDDPFFQNQWHLLNYGQTGGVSGVDLGLEQAWFETTGGLSYSGDTIIVCIIDDVFEYMHQDLLDNVWINHEEIPENGIDDDENGYVDDYHGWNVTLDSDDIQNSSSSDWHGTAVAGIAGAIGNNGKGVSGVCWNIKLMLVSRGNTTADAIAAYTYPLINRQKYNESLGEDGAFVVATNASWGVDFGTPDDAPLWCAIYDSLGNAGILNACATTNINNDVDLVGDLPTTCISDFLIATTIVDDQDIKMNAGYGASSIDLATFGENIFTTFGGNTYNGFNGTSAAAPQVAGAIGLLHTAPCPSFAAMAKNNPELAALQLKDYILNGAVPNESLEGITLTGGRMNINNSLDLLLADCDYTGCFAPYSINIEMPTSESVQISWLVEVATTSVNLRYRPVGTSEWITINNSVNVSTLENLEPCTNYEFQLQSICESGTSAFTASFSFTTDGCCIAPQEIQATPQDGAIGIVWDEITAATGYLLEWKVVGADDWEYTTAPFANYILDNLESCQSYEIRVITLCNNSENAVSGINTVTTLGCGVCLDLAYCEVNGPEESLTWIGHFSIAELNNQSGVTADGYSDFTDQSVNLTQGFVHQFSISTDYEFVLFPGYFHIWMDLNQDGDFGENELLYQSSFPQSEFSGDIYIPNSAALGSTRMRVALLELPMGPCEIYSNHGEIEDYCINLIEPTECLPPVNVEASTSETEAQISWSGNLLIDEFVINYRALGTNEWQTDQTTASNIVLTDLLPCSDYEYYLSSICDGEASYNTATQYFLTKGCGTCLDQNYCDYAPCSTAFEWIESVEFGPLNFISGNNEGYAHIQNASGDFQKGETYDLTITPGFSNDFYDEVVNVWIDYNQNGDFGFSSELILNEVSLNGQPVNTTVTIPMNAVSGSTRIRISMKYNDPVSHPCESGFEGEIEEYCINIYESIDTDPCGKPSYLDVWNVDLNIVQVTWEEMQNAVAYKLGYRSVEQENLPWTWINAATSSIQIELDTCLDREIKVQAICKVGISEFTNSIIFDSCSPITSTDELINQKESLIDLFPNPFKEHTTLYLNLETAGEIEVEVYSVTGQKQDHFIFDAPDSESQFDLSLPMNGLYVLKIFKDGRSLGVKKVIKVN